MLAISGSNGLHGASLAVMPGTTPINPQRVQESRRGTPGVSVLHFGQIQLANRWPGRGKGTSTTPDAEEPPLPPSGRSLGYPGGGEISVPSGTVGSDGLAPGALLVVAGAESDGLWSDG